MLSCWRNASRRPGVSLLRRRRMRRVAVVLVAAAAIHGRAAAAAAFVPPTSVMLVLRTPASRPSKDGCSIRINRGMVRLCGSGNDDRTSNPNNKLDKGFRLLELASGIVPQGQIVTVASESWKFLWKRFMAELAPQDKTGTYQRPTYTFQATIGSPQHPDEANRYHVYTGNPCPWCHRVVLARNLLGFSQQQLGWTVLEDNPRKASRGGWIFSDAQPDVDFGCQDLRELYETLSPGYRGRCTAPLLVDKKSRTIVSNESSDIVRILNSVALGGDDNDRATTRINLVPEELRREIDETNEWVYRLLNNGVYRCGFSTTQAAYDAAARDVRDGLQKCQERLTVNPFLCGSQFTEADLRLLPTILRFDGVYAPLFKAGGAHLRCCGGGGTTYSAIFAWLQRCWDMPAVRESIDLPDACASYYRQLFPLNPGGIVPAPVTARELGLE